jgi:hypothetical protein
MVLFHGFGKKTQKTPKAALDLCAATKAMRTSRTVVHRLLDPHDTSVTLVTLAKASKALRVRLLRVA